MVLTAYNVIGEGPASAPVEVFVGEAGESHLEIRGQQRPPRRRSGYGGSGGFWSCWEESSAKGWVSWWPQE